MRRGLRSLILGLIIGVTIGLYLGWVQFPQQPYRSDMSELAQSFRDDYLVMVAAGYEVDGDLPGAVERLNHLGVDDIGAYVQGQAERIITTAARDFREIRLLVGLAQAMRRLTPSMQPFLDLGRGQALMVRDLRPTPQASASDVPARSSPSLLSAWLVAVGLIAGLLFGLAFSWALGPPSESNTEPHQLREDDRNHYMVAIALEFKYSGDLRAALQELIALRPGQDPFQELADVACALAMDGFLVSESGMRAVRALTDLYRLQGRSGCAEQLLPGEDTVASSEPAPGPLPDATAPPPLPTKTAQSRPPQPTATLRLVATAVPQRQFLPLPARTFCDLALPALIEVYVVDYLGRGIPGQTIRVRWGNTEDIFISGLKPERGDGYADFQMEAGVSYIIDMPGASVALGAELSTATCFAPNGRESLKSWRVTFRAES